MKPKASLQSRKCLNKTSKKDENWCPGANTKKQKQKNSYNLGIKCLLILTFLLFILSWGRQPELFYRMKRHLNESLN